MMGRPSLAFQLGDARTGLGYGIGSPLVARLGRLGLDFNANLVPDASTESKVYQAQTTYNAEHPGELPPSEGSSGSGFFSNVFGSIVGGLFKPTAPAADAFALQQASYLRSQQSGLGTVVAVGVGAAALVGLVYLLKRK